MNADEIAVKLTQVDERSKSNTHRIDELAGQIDAVNSLAISVEKLVVENRHQTDAIRDVKSDVTSLTGKVEAIEQKPAKKWDSISDKVLWSLLAAVIGYAIAHLGLG